MRTSYRSMFALALAMLVALPLYAQGTTSQDDELPTSAVGQFTFEHPIFISERTPVHAPRLLTLFAVAPIGFDLGSTFVARARTPVGYTGSELILPDSPYAWVPIGIAQAVVMDWAARKLWRTGHKRWAVVMLAGVGSARTFAGIHNLRLEP